MSNDHDERPIELRLRFVEPSKERQIKRWAKRKKNALIDGDWDKLIEYSKSKGGHPSTGSG